MPLGVVVGRARPVDAALRTLSLSANKGRLWLALAALGLLLPGRTRRAALRGVAALALTSAVANGVLKPLTRRPRPLLDRTPVVRHLPRSPRTTSFPSGHAASAAAFTTGAMLESPVAGLVLAPVAAAVAYSRVHVGVHYASDVIAGAALGAGIALATRRWWPMRDIEPIHLYEPASAPALPGGDGLLVVVNPRSGRDEDVAASIRERLPASQVVELTPDTDLADLVTQRAGKLRGLGVAGGDGTVATAADVAQQQQLPLAVFPTGTLNHFARDVGVDSIADTARAVEAGTAIAADLAVVNGTPFVNSAVIGAYPAMVRRRRLLEPKLGKWLAMAVAARALRGEEPVRVRIQGRPTAVWTLFVGNCRYAPRSPFPAGRPRLDDGLLDLQYLRADLPFSRTRAALAALTTVRGRRGVYRAGLTSRLTIESVDGPVRLARDGEVGEPATTFRFTKRLGSLVVYRPAPVGSLTGP